MALVTVIIPTCNRAHLLATAIASVLNQTFQDFDIIVVDDSSNDNPRAVVEGYSDSRIRYLCHETRKGGSAARNTGIRNAVGQYVAFLDDDDEWLPQKLDKQLAVFSLGAPELGCVYTGYTVVNRANGEITNCRLATKRGDLSKELLFENPLGAGGSSVMLRRECFETVGMFDEQLPSFQDYDMWIRISKAFHFDFVAEPLVKYYFHGEKIWTNPDALSRGVDIMLSKYGEAPGVKKKLAYVCLSLGVVYCNKGNSQKGRQALAKAIKLYPWEIRHYFNMGLSFFGTDIFTRVRRIKDRLVLPAKRKGAQA
jgi:glycosyltransferase involved in cell wall biosynthesis